MFIEAAKRKRQKAISSRLKTGYYDFLCKAINIFEIFSVAKCKIV